MYGTQTSTTCQIYDLFLMPSYLILLDIILTFTNVHISYHNIDYFQLRAEL